MKLRYRAAAGTTVLLMIAFSVACAQVRTDYNHSTNFSQFHSYSWGKVRANDQLVAQRIHKAVDILMRQKGWQEKSSGGQITIFAMANVHDEKEAQTLYDGMGGWGMGWGWGGWGWGPGGGFGESNTTTYNQPVGHLVIDFFDTRTKKLVWRGISVKTLSSNPNNNRKALYKDIHEMLQKFPPHQ